MDLMILYKQVIDTLLFIWSIGFYVGGFYVTIGSVFVFASIAVVIIEFLRGLAE